jgi:putative phosphoesterase
MKYCLISDIHGNRDALKVVFDHIEDQQIDEIISLGDVYYGSFNPEGVEQLLHHHSVRYVMGNMDTTLLNDEKSAPIKAFVLKEVSSQTIKGMESWPKSLELSDDIIAFHGSNVALNDYLLHKVVNGNLIMKTENEIEVSLQDIKQSIIFCGHSHQPSIVEVNGKVVINPGSIGLQAFESKNESGKYASETGSGFARYSIVTVVDGKVLEVTNHCLSYDCSNNAETSILLGRTDYSKWMKSGFRGGDN